MMRHTFFILLFSSGIGLSGYAQSVPTKQQDIHQLMDLMGTTSLMKQSMTLFINQYRKTNTNLPDSFWTEIEKEADYQSLLDQLVPIYDKHYTHDEVKGLLTFYKSPLGQKSIRELPAIMQESSAIGRIWGEQLGKRVAERIQREQSKN